GVRLFGFFFQAEDGIRDDLVTGVQTCALPICAIVRSMAATKAIELKTAIPGPRSQAILERKARVVADPLSVTIPVVIERGEGARSEERRVGKEGRSRWSSRWEEIENLAERRIG